MNEVELRNAALATDWTLESLADESVRDPDWLREARMPKTGIRNEDDTPD